MFDNKSNITIEKSSEKSFGYIFTIFFIILGFYPLVKDQSILIWPIVIAIIIFAITIFFPKILILPNKIWLKFGMILGSVVAPIMMAIIFFITILPTGIIMKLLGKDILNIKKNKYKKSYWIDRKKTIDSMNNQF